MARPRGPVPYNPTAPRQVGILADLVARYRQHQAEGTLPRGGRGIFYDPDGALGWPLICRRCHGTRQRHCAAHLFPHCEGSCTGVGGPWWWLTGWRFPAVPMIRRWPWGGRR